MENKKTTSFAKATAVREVREARIETMSNRRSYAGY
jgi:hypothetical protein